MKKNDYLLLIATGAYSILFFQQNAGINFLIFNIVLIAILIIKNKLLLSHKKWLWSAGLCLVSAAGVFVHSSALAIIANVCSLLLLSAFSFNVVTSSLFSFLFSCYTVLTCMVYIIVDCLARLQLKEDKGNAKKGYKFFATLIVLILSFIFFILYKTSNPLFAENTKWLNLDFISFDWIGFTLIGFMLMYAFMYHKSIQHIEVFENNRPLINITISDTEVSQNNFETEQFGGLLLFILLNIMLVILNAGDIQTLYFNGGLPKNVSHSDFVHSGVGIIILSIIIATSLIMFLFRKKFTIIKNNKTLMAFVYLWIGQNILMLSSIAIRNSIYVHDFNFTYKRVGVYVWLLLCTIGLLIMLYKIYKNKSNWYLIRTNVAVWFTVLILSSTINWDVYITRYNIRNKPLSQIDFYYLTSLSDANIPELMAIANRPEIKKIKNSSSDSSIYKEFYFGQTYQQLINIKLLHYLKDYKNDWRSYDLRDKNIVEAIFKPKK